MSRPRKGLPAAVRRAVLVEAGHRCAIPTCRGTSALELHHIVEHSKGGADTEDNLIVLCAVCHARVTKGEIDTKVVRQYKANLGVLNARYGDFERRILEILANSGGDAVKLPGGRDVDLWYLLKDGILEKVPTPGGAVRIQGFMGAETFALTQSGKAFVRDWASAQNIEYVSDEDEMGGSAEYPGFAYEDETLE